MADLPLPIPDEETRSFWEYCRANELRIQQCVACGILRHPPQPMCAACGSFERHWIPVSGRGSVFSYVVAYQAIHPALAEKVPHAVFVVELTEGVRMTTNIVDWSDRVEIGTPVEVIFEEVNDEITLPKFRVVGESS